MLRRPEISFVRIVRGLYQVEYADGRFGKIRRRHPSEYGYEKGYPWLAEAKPLGDAPHRCVFHTLAEAKDWCRGLVGSWS